MANIFKSILDSAAKKFAHDPSKMIIWTGVAGWTLSALAQTGAVILNDKIPDDQKGFLVPQELLDAAINIGLFFCFTQAAKHSVSKLFRTGKFAPSKVRQYLNERKDIYGDKVGKFDFDLDKVKELDILSFPDGEYMSCKNYYTALATVSAGILSSNLITPIVRNKYASKAQKRYIDYKHENPTGITYSDGVKI